MIPKVIHYCWFGGHPLPKSAIHCIESWRRFCPEYEIRLWNENNFDIMQNTYAREAYQEKKWAFFTDYARLKIIYDEGGIYLDTDVELVKPLDRLLDCEGYMGAESGGRIATGLGFGAEPHNGIIGRLLEDYKEIHFVREDGTQDLTPCPYRNTDTLVALGLKADGSLQHIGDFWFYPEEYFAPLSPTAEKMEHFTEHTISIHHYDATWKDESFRIRKKVRKILGRNTFSDFVIRTILYFRKRFAQCSAWIHAGRSR